MLRYVEILNERERVEKGSQKPSDGGIGSYVTPGILLVVATSAPAIATLLLMVADRFPTLFESVTDTFYGIFSWHSWRILLSPYFWLEVMRALLVRVLSRLLSVLHVAVDVYGHFMELWYLLALLEPFLRRLLPSIRRREGRAIGQSKWTTCQRYVHFLCAPVILPIYLIVLFFSLPLLGWVKFRTACCRPAPSKTHPDPKVAKQEEAQRARAHRSQQLGVQAQPVLEHDSAAQRTWQKLSWLHRAVNSPGKVKDPSLLSGGSILSSGILAKASRRGYVLKRPDSRGDEAGCTVLCTSRDASQSSDGLKHRFDSFESSHV